MKTKQAGLATRAMRIKQVLERTPDHKPLVHVQRTLFDSPKLCSIFTLGICARKKVKRIGTSLVEGAVNDFSF